ncbi:uncharacterized protein KY384_001769 [Bacidia gigantensis]|uniref:uncharacterized protein n=1 Tax=Bacidia gigantensis TaxID=2732470 RepID=UPI001D043D9F|nr:uncharacterized protein KY384_001769 [Bacidia gigantensis]KAG8532987.1 hypothetical protein KY384_001769 [Bacidia gigantensis]
MAYYLDDKGLTSSQDAITALNSLQSNYAAVQSVRQNIEAKNRTAIPEMVEYVRRLGYEPSDLDRLNPIHIAGTKGKGSTSAFISSILCQYLQGTLHPEGEFQLKNVGLYTSPHLRTVRERIQINNAPISEETFTQYFFETWDRLEEGATKRKDILTKEHEDWILPIRPMYFRFLTLMAFHTFMSLGMDTAIVECGIGGEYDSTNILVKPRVCGITSLGIDHTPLLGDAIDRIAWHKAGIMKKGVPCFSAPQPPAACNVLEARAKELQAENLTFTPGSDYGGSDDKRVAAIQLGLNGDFQRTNASLAVHIAQAHLASLGHSPHPAHSNNQALPPEFTYGLQHVPLLGRCEIRQEKDITWYIDGGHTLESIKLTGTWFASHIPQPISTSNPTPSSSESSQSPTSPAPRILFFNQQTRNAPLLVQTLHQTVSNAITPPNAIPPHTHSTSSSPPKTPFTHALFTTNTTHATTGFRPELQSLNADEEAVKALSVQKELAEAYTALDAKAEVEVRASIEEGVGWCRDVARGWREEQRGKVMVLVTGSVHLVGGFLEVLETETT